MDSLPSIASPRGLPPLDSDAAYHTKDVANAIRQAIQESPDGVIGFDQWMDLALYAPGLGYYATGTTKFGASMPTGDFTTAPEMTAVFGQVLARQVAQILQGSDATTVLEFGAGSGALAEAVLHALHNAGMSVRYLILEVSPDLRARQQQRLQAFGDRVEWLDQLPEHFIGCVLANEVLDAMPVTRSEEHTSELQSRGHLVCSLLLEKKNKNHNGRTIHVA